MFQVKPFPDLLPIRIATYKETSELPTELTKVSVVCDSCMTDPSARGFV